MHSLILKYALPIVMSCFKHAPPNYVIVEDTWLHTVTVSRFPQGVALRRRPPKFGLVNATPAVIFMASFVFCSAWKNFVLLARWAIAVLLNGLEIYSLAEVLSVLKFKLGSLASYFPYLSLPVAQRQSTALMHFHEHIRTSLGRH